MVSGYRYARPGSEDGWTVLRNVCGAPKLDIAWSNAFFCCTPAKNECEDKARSISICFFKCSMAGQFTSI